MEIRNEKYIESYNSIEVHKLMLNDDVRLQCYKKAIEKNKSVFENKVVLEVGAGSGILSVFCAQAGAKTVFAVEAALDVVHLLKKVIEENNLNEVIKVVPGKIEEVTIPEKVDVIISEWMGFYLLHEGMLDSILFARKFLKEGGQIFPERAILYGALCQLPNHFGFWDNVHGVKMTEFGREYRNIFKSKPDVCIVKPDDILTTPFEMFDFNLNSVSTNDLDNISKHLVVVADKDGTPEGICLWFSVIFPGETKNEQVILSTSPNDPETHWKQTVLVIPEEIVSPLEEQDPFAFHLSITRDVSINPRWYQLNLEVEDVNEVKHPMGCKCYFPRCLVISAHLLHTEGQGGES